MAIVRTNFKKGPARHFIREWRKHRGMTLEELAEIVGVTHGAISQLERGQINYTQPMLEALASALNCTPGDLVEHDPTADDPAWEMHEKIKAASPEQQKRALEIVTALLKAG